MNRDTTSPPGQKTYWHLLPLKRKPTEYEVVTSRLLYYVENGFEVRVPLQEWYDRYQKGSSLVCGDWERFYDPRETTYTKYTSLQSRRELLVDDVLDSIDAGRDRRLPASWIAVLERVLAPVRYPWHGFQMVAAYLGQMGPSGRIVIAAMFQAADEIRRVQRVAYRMRQLQIVHPGFGDRSRAAWQSDPLWQPLRETVEKLLVTFDWGECFVALNLAVKPAVDELFMKALARVAEGQGDAGLGRMLSLLAEDCAWHREWSQAMVATALQDSPANEEVIAGWMERWRPMALRATAPFDAVLDPLRESELRPCS